MNTESLENLGLEEKEVKIYLSLLKLNQATATKISEETRIERTLCYSIIQKLIDKGLVSYIIENNVKYFKPAPPQKLMQDLKEKEEELKQILPELINLTKFKQEKTKAEIYQGKEGIKIILRDLIDTKEDYFVFGEEGRFQETLPIESEQFMVKIEEAKIKEKVLVRKGKKIVKSKNSQFRYIPEDYLSPTSTVIYGNKIAILIWSEPLLVVLIENKDVADSYRSYFKMLWELVTK
jgi:sugar-specific transcriptional regulator TrmB